MRDIRPELRERLKDIEEDRESMKAQLKLLEERERKVCALIEDEDQRWSDMGPSFLSSGQQDEEGLPKGSVGLGDIILGALSDGRAWAMDEFKTVAIVKGWPVNRNAAGRSLNMALQGLQARGMVEKFDTGEWRLVENDVPPSEESEAQSTEPE